MRSILVVVTRQIGDVLLTTPLIHSAKLLWPGAAIDVVGISGTLGMLRGNADVRELISIPADAGNVGTLRVALGMWKRYDLALIADPGDKAHLLGAFAARVRTGILPRDSRSNWWKRRLLKHTVTSEGDLGHEHVVIEKLRLLSPWERGDARAAMLVGPPGEPLPASLPEKLASGYVVMHTPSMWTYKQWPLAHFRELARLLAAEGRQVVLTGGPGEHDRACVAAMQGAAPAELLVDAGVLNFNQLATLLRGAALYIGPDTSISHLAAACGVKVLAIFGPTNPQRWAPWPSAVEQPVRFARQAPAQTVGTVTLMQASLPCVPCGKAGCDDRRDSRTECLPAILPERVAEEALKLLAQ